MTSIAPLPDLDAIPPAPVPATEPETARLLGYRRTPRDLFRSIVYALITLVLLVPTLWAQDTILAFERDLLKLLDFPTPTLAQVCVGILQALVAGSLLAVWLRPIFTRHYRLVGYLAVASVAAGLLGFLLHVAITGTNNSLLGNAVARRVGISSEVFPSIWGLAALAASFVVVSPFVTRRERHVGVGIFTVVVLLRIAVSVDVPVSMFVSIALGATAGAVVLYAFGRPDERPTDGAVLASLRAAGLPVARLDPAQVDARGSTPYFGTFEDGRPLFVKVLGTDERSADLLFRVYRYIRYRNLGDERPFSSLRRAVEHEAFVSLQARDVGVRTPRMRAVAKVGPDCLLLAYDGINGLALDTFPPDHLTDDRLREIWEQVGILRRHRIAHRDLRQSNLMVDPDGEVWIIDFGFAEVAVTDALLDADVAQLTASLAVLAGAERTVDTAIEVLGRDALVTALPRLQMGALSGATQTKLRHHPGLLQQVQDVIEDRTGVTEVRFEPITRVGAKQLFTVVMLVAVTYFLLPQFADLPEVWDHVKDASWWWFVPVLLASAATYVGATIAFLGSVPEPLPPVPAGMAQVAGSFVSKVAPAGLGGMALNIRFAQKSGVDSAVAVSAVGLDTAGGFLVHVAMLFLFGIWAGKSAFGEFSLPDPVYLLIGFGAVLLFAAAALAVPAVRQLVRRKLLPILGRGLRSMNAIAREPVKLLMLVAGSALVTFSYVVALYFATLAFGGELDFAVVGVAFLAGSAIATVAPTPGGLGAVEAALVAGLTASGMPGPVALPAVFLMRFGTFWLPTLPGWLAFTWLRRGEHI